MCVHPAAPETTHVGESEAPGEVLHPERWNGVVGEGGVYCGADGADWAEGWDEGV